MNNTDLMFTMTVDDVQQIAQGFVGRELTMQELQQVKNQLDADREETTKLIIRLAIEE
jgi:hypothetical protein